MIGETVGNYKITSCIGKGGMGVVYLAEHAMLGSKTAVKVLPPDLSQEREIVDRFFNEAKAATRVRHPGIVQVFDFGIHRSGSAYIVMELLEGETLTARIERGRLRPVAAAIIARQIASALWAAHKNGIIHRDLKPDNLFLIPDPDMPEGERVKVLDFGIAKLAESKSAKATRSGEVFGTPYYMSPEQCRSAADVDHRTDIYALGCILYEMLTGQPPFLGNSLPELITAHLFNRPRSPREFGPEMPSAIEKIVMRALAKSADERQLTMQAMTAELDAAIGRRIPTPLPFPAVTYDSDRSATTPQALPVTPHAKLSTTLGQSSGQLVPRQLVSRQAILFGAISAAVLALALITTVIVRSSSTGTDNKRSEAASPVASKSMYTVVPIQDVPGDASDSSGAGVTSNDSPHRSDGSSSGSASIGSQHARVRHTEAPVDAAAATRDKAPDHPAEAAPAVVDEPMGTLALGAKPPCDIYIDGKPTGLRTPKPSLRLDAGTHEITLVNTDYAIKESFTVEIRAGATTRQIKDFSDRISPSQSDTHNPFK